VAVGYWLSTWGSNWVHKIVLVQVMAQMAVSSHSFWHLGHFIDFLRLVQSLAQQPVKFNRLILIGLIKAKKGPQSYLQKTVTPLGNWLAWIRAHHTSQSAHPPSKSVRLKNVKKKVWCWYWTPTQRPFSSPTHPCQDLVRKKILHLVNRRHISLLDTSFRCLYGARFAPKSVSQKLLSF